MGNCCDTTQQSGQIENENQAKPLLANKSFSSIHRGYQKQIEERQQKIDEEHIAQIEQKRNEEEKQSFVKLDTDVIEQERELEDPKNFKINAKIEEFSNPIKQEPIEELFFV